MFLQSFVKVTVSWNVNKILHGETFFDFHLGTYNRNKFLKTSILKIVQKLFNPIILLIYRQ